MDKRDRGPLFRERLREVMRLAGGSQTAFAASVGIDRSALSQLLSERAVRLPRAETLAAIAERYGVSTDWLLGLIQSEHSATEIRPMLELEHGDHGPDDSRLQRWRQEAAGYKIRYVPATLPDLMRTERVIRYELGQEASGRLEAELADADRYLAYTRRPETDMEVCMPLQALSAFARGEAAWAGLERAARREQILHMARLLQELYPTFRLFLYDGRRQFSAPFTVFGPLRAAIYLGGTYVVFNATQHIRALSEHFDRLIRHAIIQPPDVPAFLRRLAADCGPAADR